jgi:hypothetical protein
MSVLADYHSDNRSKEITMQSKSLLAMASIAFSFYALFFLLIDKMIFSVGAIACALAFEIFAYLED